MPKMVGIAGTHSTGKSTMVGALRKFFLAKGLKVGEVADNASDCLDAGFGILRDHTFESTLWIMASVIRSELEMGLHSDIVLVDRPVPDALGYLEAALETEGRTISSGERSYLYSLARHHGKRYDVVLKTVLDETIPLGPGRDPDAAFRVLVDAKIELALSELEPDVATTHYDDRSDLIDCVAHIF